MRLVLRLVIVILLAVGIRASPGPGHLAQDLLCFFLLLIFQILELPLLGRLRLRNLIDLLEGLLEFRLHLFATPAFALLRALRKSRGVKQEAASVVRHTVILPAAALALLVCLAAGLFLRYSSASASYTAIVVLHVEVFVDEDLGLLAGGLLRLFGAAATAGRQALGHPRVFLVLASLLDVDVGGYRPWPAAVAFLVALRMNAVVVYFATIATLGRYGAFPLPGGRAGALKGV